MNLRYLFISLFVQFQEIYGSVYHSRQQFWTPAQPTCSLGQTLVCSEQIASSNRFGAVRQRRNFSAEKTAAKGVYARVFGNFRSRRLISDNRSRTDHRPREQVLSLGVLKKSIVAPDKKWLSCLVGILDADVLAEITDEDPSFRIMQRVLFLQRLRRIQPDWCLSQVFLAVFERGRRMYWGG